MCSGQSKCYNNTVEMASCPTSGDFYGQNGNYTSLCDVVTYNNVTTDTATSGNTGLMWQRETPDSFTGCTKGTPAGSRCTYAEAINYCNDLVLGGHEDWRLPQINELETLINYGRKTPAASTTVFPSMKSIWYWSVTENPLYSSEAYYVNFNLGEVLSASKTNVDGLFVRCVRGDELQVSYSFTEHTHNGDTIVTDVRTGLQWTKERFSQNWQGALNYCENLNYGGCSDWRLPNIFEMKSLINKDAKQPASEFPDFPSGDWIWTSTTNVDEPDKAWYVFSAVISVSSFSKTTSRTFYCVR